MLELIVTENGSEIKKRFKNLKEIEKKLNGKINYQMLRQVYELSNGLKPDRTSNCKVNKLISSGIKILDVDETNIFLDIVKTKDEVKEETKPEIQTIPTKKRGRPLSNYKVNGEAPENLKNSLGRPAKQSV